MARSYWEIRGNWFDYEQQNTHTHAHAHARIHTYTIMRKCHREFRQKRKSVPAESWGTFVGYCVPQLIAVCVLYTEIKISTLFE